MLMHINGFGCLFQVLFGFVIGDLLLFRAFVVIGAKTSLLIMSLAPFIAAIIGLFVLNEPLRISQLLGMILTFLGIAVVILKNEPGIYSFKLSKLKKIKLVYPVTGLLLACGGAIGQGTGLVFSKLGMNGYDVFTSSQIRVIAGILGFAVLIPFTAKLQLLKNALFNIFFI